MGSNLINSILEKTGVTNNDVSNFFPDLLNNLTNSVSGGKLSSLNDLLGKGNKKESDANADNDVGRIVKAIFVLCCSKNDSNSIPAPYLNELAGNLDLCVRIIFKTVFDIGVNFKFYSCADEQFAKNIPEELQFTHFEGFETKKDSTKAYNRKLLEDKKTTNKNTVDRGIKVLKILPASNDNPHSSAEKGGIVGYIYQNHVNDYFKPTYKTVKDFYSKPFDITLIHEICHLFGLSDRYQFLMKHKLGSSGDCIESVTTELIPYAVDPAKDNEALYPEQVLDNLMFGMDIYCRRLTTYQKNIIWGYENAEDDYKKVTLLIPEGAKLETNSNAKQGLLKRVSFTNQDIGNRKNIPIIGVDSQGNPFTYTNIKNLSGGEVDYSGENILLNNSNLSKGFNDKIGLAVFDENNNEQSNSNSLGTKLVGLKYCDSRTINPIKSTAVSD